MYGAWVLEVRAAEKRLRQENEKHFSFDFFDKVSFLRKTIFMLTFTYPSHVNELVKMIQPYPGKPAVLLL